MHRGCTQYWSQNGKNDRDRIWKLWSPAGDNENKTQLGLYINFLKLKDVIVMPAYETAEDDQAALILEKAYRRPVILINSKELAKRGGIINCVTWDN